MVGNRICQPDLSICQSPTVSHWVNNLRFLNRRYGLVTRNYARLRPIRAFLRPDESPVCMMAELDSRTRRSERCQLVEEEVFSRARLMESLCTACEGGKTH